VEPFSDSNLQFLKVPKCPGKAADLFRIELTSGEMIDPAVFGLRQLTERSFLLSLAHALDSAVAVGLDIARRIGWDGERHAWQLGELNRAYYVTAAERAPGEIEPDEYHRGIAPSVKLLYAVVLRLVDVDLSAAIEFGRRWSLTNSPVHLRLWAAMARSARIVPAGEVSAWLLSLGDRHFWDLHGYPEIAELRATRFAELGRNFSPRLGEGVGFGGCCQRTA